MINQSALVSLYADRIREAYENKKRLFVRGSGSKAFFIKPEEGQVVLDAADYNGIISYEPSELVITVRCGTSLRAVESMLASRGQQFPFEAPGYGPVATVGGMVASGFSGPRRAFSGAVRDALLGVKMINGKGEVLEFGGQVIKNVAGYDVTRLMCGAFGSLGMLLELSLKVVPKPPVECTFRKTVGIDQAYTEMTRLRCALTSITGLAYDDGQLYMRVAGSEATLRHIGQDFGGELLYDADSWWRALREHELQFFTDPRCLWRISLPPAAAALDLPGDSLIDWAGGLRWLYSDAPAEDVHLAVKNAGGHACAFRNAPIGQARYAPLDDITHMLSRRLQDSFDPGRVFAGNQLFAEKRL